MFKRVISIFVILLLISLIVNFGKQIAKFQSAGRILEDKKREVVILNQEKAKLEEELEKVQTSEYVEVVAREKLGMAKEEERIIIMPQFDNDTLAVKNQSEIGKGTVSNLSKWWRIFVY